MTVLADTGALYALLDDKEEWHQRVRGWVASSQDSLVVPATVVQETAFLIGRRVGAKLEAEFLRNAAAGAWLLESLAVEDISRAADLVEKYSDFPLGFVDASIIAIAERLDVRGLLTTDRRHFGVIRPAHCERLRLLP